MPAPLTWDIFCRAIDNYGDAGVCWRLACQLAREQQARVRLWVDQLAVLHALCPDVDVTQTRQQVWGVEVRHWSNGWPPSVELNDVVIEAFGCGLPEPYIAVMLARTPPPLWITLEYLSAEAWVVEHHGLPSPHPRFPLDRYFFFPGFMPGTGGVLREGDLAPRRAAFGETGRAKFWRACGFSPPPAGSVVVSLFAYAGAPVELLLARWEHGDEPLVAAVPEGSTADRVREYFGVTRGGTGLSLRRGKLEARILPFVPQPRYDELLWSCDINFVRGEDSFVRAQWAGRPFVWHVYPQEAGAHRLKLDAFLDLYAEGLEYGAAASLATFWRGWNLMDATPVNVAEAWIAFRSQCTALKAHATVWAERAARVGDMATNLAQFARERVK
jgi:uncharacterized repeat protein (TIGR03837 family)